MAWREEHKHFICCSVDAKVTMTVLKPETYHLSPCVGRSSQVALPFCLLRAGAQDQGCQVPQPGPTACTPWERVTGGALARDLFRNRPENQCGLDQPIWLPHLFLMCAESVVAGQAGIGGRALSPPCVHMQRHGATAGARSGDGGDYRAL